MKKTIQILILLLLSTAVMGQLTPVTNHYVLNPLLINPAYAGARGTLNVSTFYRKQWAGIKGAPNTRTLIIDAPMSNNKVGLGFIIMGDKTGVTKETQFNTNYSYKILLGKGTLALGIGAGITTTNTAWSDLDVIDPGDDYYMIDSKLFAVPGFSFGSYYSNSNFFMGFSIPKLLNYKYNLEKNKYTLANDPKLYNYLISAGFNIDVSSKFRFVPSTLLTYSDHEGLLYDLNANFIYSDRFWIGLSYRNNRSLATILQMQVSKQLKVGYSYDFDIGKLGRYSSGSHEIMLRYDFRYDVDVVNPLIF